ncbi:GNAT family N-acetyltransferase [Sediminicoccus sp. KRV36]|uniref:GNAT family N-acetyltransferase n=1 Tax=Sediminicoccus sp. KRV36 TaxID=3133721 RepID=UPI00200F90D1|nr:GNAT family N-acetyltransferase [Sediminicoccus rosea]UPY36411.1 GNAT family N-acetyltransferase [Sediminicoccus rosea]
MKLIAAQATDAPGLAALHATAFPAGAAWSAGTITTLLAMEGVFGLHAPGGFILARRVLDEAEILTLAVHPAHRQQGLGLALVETSALVAATAGARVMFLEVDEANAPAMALYTKAGFAQAGLRRDYYAPGRHAWLLRRSLEA